MATKIIKASYSNQSHCEDIVHLLNAYASDPMGGSQPLTQYVRENLTNELSKRAYAFSVIAYVNNTPVGLINCFEAFSTFSCKPLVNIHDVAVLKGYRGQQLSQKMLEKVEEIAEEKGCCKITLEVLSGNDIAKAAYVKYGFKNYELDPEVGHAEFWEKKLL